MIREAPDRFEPHLVIDAPGRVLAALDRAEALRLIRSIHGDSLLARRITNLMRLGGSFNVLIAVHEAHRVDSLILTAQEIQKVLPHRVFFFIFPTYVKSRL